MMYTSGFSSYAPPIHSPALSLQRQGRFDLVVGKTDDVNKRLTDLKQAHDPYGQLSLSANVIETNVNLEFVPTGNPVLNTLVNYIDFDNQMRNGKPGEQASFIYPLKQPDPETATPPTRLLNAVLPSPEVRIGIYADGEDLRDFLNSIGPKEWEKAARQPDTITQYALNFATNKNAGKERPSITIDEVSPDFAQASVSPFSQRSSRLNQLA